MSRLLSIGLIVAAVSAAVVQGTSGDTTDEHITDVFLDIVKEAEQYAIETVPQILALKRNYHWTSLDDGKCFWIYPPALAKNLARSGLRSHSLDITDHPDKRLIQFEVRSVGLSFYIYCAKRSTRFDYLAQHLKARRFKKARTESALEPILTRALKLDGDVFVRLDEPGIAVLRLRQDRRFIIAHTARIMNQLMQPAWWPEAYISCTPTNPFAKPSPVTVTLTRSRTPSRAQRSEQQHRAAGLPLEPPSATPALLARIEPAASLLRHSGEYDIDNSIQLLCTECAQSRLVYNIVLNAVAVASGNQPISLQTSLISSTLADNIRSWFNDNILR